MIQTASGAAAVTAKTDLAIGTLKGKQRGTFGGYLVYNNDLQSVQIDRMTSAGLGAKYTTAAESAVELLGAHEFYWWGWGNQLLAKLSDGASFKFYRIANDFETISAQAPSAQADIEKIEQAQKNLFHL